MTDQANYNSVIDARDRFAARNPNRAGPEAAQALQIASRINRLLGV